MDADEYPTNEELELIQKWDGDFSDLMEFVHRNCWWAPDWGWHEEEGDFYLSTGGRSGNESVIQALKENFIFWSLHFKSRRTGGHFFFCVNPNHSRLIEHKICRECKGTGYNGVTK